MTTTGSDISLVLSGGGSNLDPDLSLGGASSVTPITSELLNNLFDDVTSDQNLDGLEDYRCVYFFNDGDTTIYGIKVFILEDFDGGATMELGIAEQDEKQRIFLTGLPSGGSCTLSYDENEIELDYDSDLGNMSVALQNALNALVDDDGQHILKDVVVTAQPVSSNIIFDILFTGDDGSRDHPLIELISNDFTPSVTITISTTQSGFPINTVAPDIGVATTPPGGVGFFAANENSPITLPKLRPTDGFPIWIKRVVEANTEAKANDGLNVRFQAESLGE